VSDGGDDDGWRAALAAVVAGAPDELRVLASTELHIGGFTSVRLEHPVLDLRAVADDVLAGRALAFFVAGALLSGASVARVHVRAGPPGALLARAARRSFRPALARVDDESVALLRYFDLYLQPADALDPAARGRLVRALERALRGRP
jgi:hypothetical protein